MQQDRSPRPLLSVVIATRNRIPYAKSAILSILKIRDSRLEVVVQDNSDNRDLERWASGMGAEARLIYRYTPPPLSSIGNFIAALELVRGEYLCLIGDDDGVNPEILEAADWAKERDLDALTPLRPVSYIWPNTNIKASPWAKVTGGDLTLGEFGSPPFQPDSERELKKVVSVGCSSYNSFFLPKLYHGLVHRRCLEKIRERTGCFLGGLSPDIYSALAIACVTRKMLAIDYPLTIAGVCGVSSSAVEGGRRQDVRDLKSAPHFRDRGEYKWSETVPPLYCVETIWADSGIASLTAMGREDLLRKLDVAQLCARCIAANRGVAGIVLRHYTAFGQSLQQWSVFSALRLLCVYGRVIFAKQASRVRNRINIIAGRTVTIRLEQAEDIDEATANLVAYLKESRRSFRSYIGSSCNDTTGPT